MEKIILFINNYINPIAILLTAISFSVFIVGKILTSTRGNWSYTEKIYYNPNDDLMEEFNIIETYSDYSGDGSILVTSNEILYNIKLIRLDDNMKSIGEPIISIKKLMPGEAISIETYFPCGLPQFYITWEKYNYMKAYFYLGENLKTGYKNQIEINYIKTWRTILYHFFA